MPRRAKYKPAEHLSTQEGEVLLPRQGEERAENLTGVVTLGVGSRSSVVEEGSKPDSLQPFRGLLPVPPEVEAEVKRQEEQHPMTPEYRKTLCDRLTLEHYFADVPVAFRRTPNGIEVVAAGLDEIDQFRKTTSAAERQGVVYGVG